MQAAISNKIFPPQEDKMGKTEGNGRYFVQVYIAIITHPGKRGKFKARAV